MSRSEDLCSALGCIHHLVHIFFSKYHVCALTGLVGVKWRNFGLLLQTSSLGREYEKSMLYKYSGESESSSATTPCLFLMWDRARNNTVLTRMVFLSPLSRSMESEMLDTSPYLNREFSMPIRWTSSSISKSSYAFAESRCAYWIQFSSVPFNVYRLNNGLFLVYGCVRVRHSTGEQYGTRK